MLDYLGLTDKDAALIGTALGALIAAVIMGLRGYLAKPKDAAVIVPPAALPDELRRRVYQTHERLERVEATVADIEDKVDGIYRDTQVLRERRGQR